MPKSLRTPAQLALQRLLVETRGKMNQAEVAARLKRPQSFVSKYENGERRLDIIEFCAVARALSADPVEFLKQLIDVADL